MYIGEFISYNNVDKLNNIFFFFFNFFFVDTFSLTFEVFIEDTHVTNATKAFFLG
jgi:hypothetical protein